MEEVKITVLVTTCDRYETTLPLCLLSIINQTKLPQRIILVDDSKIKKFYSYQILKHIITICKFKNIVFDYYHGESKGMVPAIKLGLEKINDGWVYKIDDDNVLEPNVFEFLCEDITDKVGAIGGIFIDKNSIEEYERTEFYNRMEDIFFNLNIQMIANQSCKIKQVEHLYSNYFFRKGIEELHPENLNPSGHREDTIFTYSIFKKGYQIIVNPKAKIYHLDIENEDGNRIYRGEQENKNELIFLNKLKEWQIIPNKFRIFIKNGFIVLEKSNKMYSTHIKVDNNYLLSI